MAFDYKGAREEGYEDAEIIEHLQRTHPDFDFQGAHEEGYTLEEVTTHLAPREQPEPETSYISDITGAIGRGIKQKQLGTAVSELAGTTAPMEDVFHAISSVFGERKPEREVVRLGEELRQIEQPEYYKEYMKRIGEAGEDEPEGFVGGAKAIYAKGKELISDPKSLALLAAESLPHAPAAFAGGVVGNLVLPGVGTAVGAATAGGVAEFEGEFLDLLGKKGIDITDEAALRGAAKDKKLMNEIAKESGLKAFGIVATDIASYLLGGKFFGKVARTVPGKMAKKTAEGVYEVTTEGAGEAVGQQLARGEVDLTDVVVEAGAGLPGAGRDMVLRSIDSVRKKKNATEVNRVKPDIVEEVNSDFSPNDIHSIPADEVKVDPETYQIRSRVDEEGVTENLKGVKEFDPVKADTLVLHEKKNGELFVADGHHRVELAKRLSSDEKPINVNAFIVSEKNGYTPQMAMEIAAKKNIAQGSVDAIDVAKLYRLNPVETDVELDKSTLKGRKVLTTGKNLARLKDSVFLKLVKEDRLKPEYAQFIGRSVMKEEEQDATYNFLIKSKPTSNLQAKYLVDAAAASGFHKTETDQIDMFGGTELQTNAVNRAKLIADIVGNIQKDKRMFARLVKGEKRITEAGNILAMERNLSITEEANKLVNFIEINKDSDNVINNILKRYAAKVTDKNRRELADKAYKEIFNVYEKTEKLARTDLLPSQEKAKPKKSVEPDKERKAKRKKKAAAPEIHKPSVSKQKVTRKAGEDIAEKLGLGDGDVGTDVDQFASKQYVEKTSTMLVEQAMNDEIDSLKKSKAFIRTYLGVDPDVSFNLKKMLASTKTALSRTSLSSLAMNLRYYVYSVLATANANLRLIGNKAGTGKTVNKIADMFSAPAGVSDRTIGGTFFENLDTVSRRRLEIVGTALSSVKTMKGEVSIFNALMDSKKAENLPSKLVNPYKIIKAELKKHLNYLNESGLDVGEVEDYVSLWLADVVVNKKSGKFLKDAEKAYEVTSLDEIAAHKKTLEDKQLTLDPDERKAMDKTLIEMEKAHEEKRVTGAFARSADALFESVVEGETLKLGDVGKDKANISYSRKRKFSPRAQEILEQYYDKDIRSVLTRYIRSTVRKAEFTQRFGGKNWDKLAKEMKSEGMRVRDINKVAQEVLELTGFSLITAKKFSALDSFLNVLRLATTVRYLNQAWISALNELATPAIRSGNVLDLAKGVSTSISAILKTKDYRKQKQLAALMGVLTDGVSSMESASRFSFTERNMKSLGKLGAKYFEANLLQSATRVERVSGTSVATHFLVAQADDIVTGNDGKLTQDALSELGIEPAKQKGFAKWLVENQDNLRAQIIAEDPNAILLQTAALRMVNQSVVMPTMADRPTWARTTLGSFIFLFKSFSWAFHTQVMNRNIRLMKKALAGKEYKVAERMKLMAPMMMTLGVLVPLSYAAGEFRDYIFRSKKYRKLTPTEKIKRATSRSGILGALDPLANLFLDMRYSQSLMDTISGASLSNVNELATAISNMVSKNSPNTNTAERMLASTIYSSIIMPSIILGLSHLGSTHVLTRFASQYLTTPEVKNGVVDFFAGIKAVKGRGSSRRRKRGGNRSRRR